jgi:hypothetical protein
MAKKQPKVNPDDILKQMYPDLLTSDDYEAEEAKKAAAAKPDDTATTIANLQAQLAGLEGQLATVGRANTVLSSQAQTDMPPVKPQVDYSKAPDPATDPAGFAQFMDNVTQSRVNYEKEAYNYTLRQQSAASNKTAVLWKDFEGNYPAYAKNAERVEIAASRVIEKARALGQDTDKYMYGNSAGFMKDVVKEIDRIFGKVEAEADDDEGDDEGDDNRTGVFGGGQAAGSPQAVGRQPQERYGTLSKDIMAWQQKTGFHR